MCRVYEPKGANTVYFCDEDLLFSVSWLLLKFTVLDFVVLPERSRKKKSSKAEEDGDEGGVPEKKAKHQAKKTKSKEDGRLLRNEDENEVVDETAEGDKSGKTKTRKRVLGQEEGNLKTESLESFSPEKKSKRDRKKKSKKKENSTTDDPSSVDDEPMGCLDAEHESKNKDGGGKARKKETNSKEDDGKEIKTGESEEGERKRDRRKAKKGDLEGKKDEQQEGSQPKVRMKFMVSNFLPYL